MKLGQEQHDAIIRELVDRGLIIEAGFLSLRLLAMPEDGPVLQVREMRKAFFAGAQHVFASVFAVLGPGEEATDAELKRLDLINAELERFVTQMKRGANANEN